MARQAAAPGAPPSGTGGGAPAPLQGPKGARRPDETTRKVPNPLLVQHKAPAAPPAPPRLDPVPPITTKLLNASQAWDEFNAMPVTPAPVSMGQASLGAPAVDLRPKKSRGLLLGLLAVVIVGGAIAAVFSFRETSAPPPSPLPEPEAKAPVVVVPENPVHNVQNAPVPTEAPPAPAVPSPNVRDREPPQVEPSASPAKVPSKKVLPAKADLRSRPNPKKVAAAAHGGQPRERPSEPMAKPLESVPTVKPVVEPSEDFGMDLTRPAARRQIKKMDEKDPYSP